MKSLQIARLMALAAFALALALGPHRALAATSGPSVFCHVTDGVFTDCDATLPGPEEWKDVPNDSFLGGASLLYVNQDALHHNLYLMYDNIVRTTPLGPEEFGTVRFFTIEDEVLEFYVVWIFSDGTVQVFVDGVDKGRGLVVGGLRGAAGFAPSPNFATPHVMYELQVPLVPGSGTVYSPDPLFWSNTVPGEPGPQQCPPNLPFPCDGDGDGRPDFCCTQQGPTGLCAGECQPFPRPEPEKVNAAAAVVTANPDGTTEVRPLDPGFRCPVVDEAALCNEVAAGVDLLCPPTATYRNHGQYVSCVGSETERLLLAKANLGCFNFPAVQSCVVHPRARSNVGS